MIIDKLTIELHQDADNQTGFERAEIIVKPALLGLFNNHKPDYFFQIKSGEGFSFEDKQEIIDLFDRIEEIVSKCDI